MRIQEELRAIDEEAMYQAPATTYRTIDKAAALLDEAERVVEESAVVIEEAANILRERLPSLADNVLMPVAHKSRAFLAKLRKEQDDGQ